MPFLPRAPLMRRLIDRFVWVGIDAQGAAHTFRPTPEGDFTDAHDSPVDLTPFNTIRLAHRTVVSEESTRDWEQHLTDYEVTPLFAQFSRPPLDLPANLASRTRIEDREGWASDGLTIRAAATRLGYERGPSSYDMDMRFVDYRKTFPSAGFIAVISFTGNSVPEQAIPVALTHLTFKRTRDASHRIDLKLADVPPVLLSECWNDYHEIAAEAVYDPAWIRRTAR